MNHILMFFGRIGLFFLFAVSFQLALSGPAAADTPLYRCEVGDRVEFRQTACEEGEQSSIQIIEHTSGVTPTEPGLRLKKPSEKTDAVQKVQHTGASEQQCWKRRQQLERVERQLRSGYKPSRYQRLHDRQDEYESYLHQFCR